MVDTTYNGMRMTCEFGLLQDKMSDPFPENGSQLGMR